MPSWRSELSSRGDRTLGARVRVADIERRLGSDHHLIAPNRLQRFAEHRFGAIGGGRVEQVDAEVERLTDQGDRLGLALAPSKPEPAEPAAAEPGDTHPQPGSAKRYVFHATACSRNAMLVSSSRPHGAGAGFRKVPAGAMACQAVVSGRSFHGAGTDNSRIIPASF